MYQTLEFQGPSLSEKKFKNSAVPDSNVIFLIEFIVSLIKDLSER